MVPGSMRATTGELFPAPEGTPPARPACEGYASVVLNRPVRTQFTYGVPPQLAGRVRAGMRVAVPFGNRRHVGVVVGVPETPDVDPAKVRLLHEVLDEQPLVGDDLLALTRWMADEYACSWGEALHGVLPAALKRERGPARVLVVAAAPGVGPEQLAELEDRHPKQHRLLRTLLELGDEVELREVLRSLGLSESPARTLARRGLATLRRVVQRREELLTARSDRARPEQLTPDQRRAVDAVGNALAAGEATTFLLRGVTGSGKTEVYLRAIEQALERGRGAIVLVPEIALTPQTVGWFRSRFGEVAVLHSRMTDSTRLAMWQRVRAGEARVVVGARSALFAPLPDLGVVVVDEEHEPSFKQESTPRYHARDVAVRRAREAGAVCILGSATPSLESWHRAAAGDYRRLELPTRIGGAPMPPVDVVDVRAEPRGSTVFSRELRQRMESAVARGEQVILFLNRRGWAPVLWCRECKETVRCEQCDQALTFHQRLKRAVCHRCCEEVAPPAACPTCTAPALRYLGAGSERIEHELRALLPDARVLRMDSDTMRRREDYEQALDRFGRGEVDVLVGTQMIAKGLDFPRVTVVGIVSADVALHLPDFRAAERTFQLVSQVAGRAGRGELPGRIVVQTGAPEHPAIRLAAGHDFDGFCRWEDELRRELGYPPHGRLLRAVLEDEEEARVADAARDWAERLRAELPDALSVLGPAPAPIAFVRKRHRHHLLVKAPPDALEAFAAARSLLTDLAGRTSRPRATVDVDPASVL